MNEIFNEDCVRGMSERLEPESVDLTVTSIPFGALFMYSGKTEDIGNNQDGTDFVRSMFGLHLRFFCEQLFGVTRPGTNACIHIQQLVSYRVEHGYMGRRDFRGAVVDVFEQAGFEWKGEVTIPKNPQVIAQRQKLHSLLFVTGRRDARQLAPAVNDHLLIFQRPGEAPPVPALRGDGNPDGWVTTEEWIKWAHGTWDDIRETDVLEGWKHGRDEDDEKHVCPLQLEVIRRCVKLYSNPGELVLDPFMGIGSTAFVAAQEGREFAGFELKDSYHRLAVRNASRALQGGDEAQLAIEVA
jgi:DNA modification methylase